MNSIYHIDTDIECKVLHYGKELCIARPGEDTCIELRKGRHKLSFVSTENVSDQYSIMFEVPENDIEDCIEIRLTSCRDGRLQIEAEEKRLAQEAEWRELQEIRESELAELNQKREEERAQREKEETEKRLYEARKNEFQPVNDSISFVCANVKKETEDGLDFYTVYIHKESGQEFTSLPGNYLFPYNEYVEKKGYALYKLLDGGIDSNGNKCRLRSLTIKERVCPPRYLHAGSFYYDRALVEDSDGKWSYIDTGFSSVIAIPDQWQASSFLFGVAFLMYSSAGIDRCPREKDVLVKIIDLDGRLLFEKSLLEITQTYCGLDFFPFRFLVQQEKDGLKIDITDKKARYPDSRSSIAINLKKRTKSLLDIIPLNGTLLSSIPKEEIEEIKRKALSGELWHSRKYKG